MQAMLTSIQQLATRNAIPGEQLLRGMNTGTDAGVGPGMGADMVVKMQHALTDLGQAAEYQRMSLQAYGVTTKDANTALREMIVNLSKVSDSQAKTLTAQSFGLDPAMLTLATAARLNPMPGGQGELEQRQATRAADLEAANARLQDRVQAAQLNATTTMWGYLSSQNAIRTGGEYTGTDYNTVLQNLRLQRADIATQTEAGRDPYSGQITPPRLGFWGGMGAQISNMAATAQTNLGSVLPFGMVPPANWAVDRSPDTRPGAQTPPQFIQAMEEFNRSIGRFTPQGIQAQLTQEQRRGQDIVNAITDPELHKRAQEDLDKGWTFLSERLMRMGDPVGQITVQLQRQADVMSLPSNQQALGKVLLEAQQAQERLTGPGVLNENQRFGVTQAFDAQTAGRGGSTMIDTQRSINDQKDLAAAYTAGGGALEKIKAAQEAANEVWKNALSPLQAVAREAQLMDQALLGMDAKAQAARLAAEQNNILTGNIAAAGGDPVAQRLAGIKNEAMGKTDYTNRYNMDISTGNYADIAALNRLLNDMMMPLLKDLANENQAARAKESFTTQQQTNALTGAVLGGGLSPAQARATMQAQQELQAQGPTTPGQVAARAQEILAKSAADAAAAMEAQIQSERSLLPIEQQRAAAIMAGVPAEKEFADNLKIATDIEKLKTLVTKEQLPLVEKINKELTDNATALRASNQEADKARIIKAAQDAQAASGREIGAFYSGGPNAMAIQGAAEPTRAALIAAGDTPEQAEARALEIAKAAKAAADMKTALTDASTEMATTMKSAVSDMVQGLESGIGKAHGLRMGLQEAGLAISKLGLDMFVTKPLGVLADNIASGRGANFNVGTSGLSYTGALGAAASAAWKGMTGSSDTPNKGAGMYSAQAPHGNDAATATDIGKGVDVGVGAYKASGKDNSPGFLSSLFGGSDTWLGRQLSNSSKDSSKDSSRTGATGGSVGSGAGTPGNSLRTNGETLDTGQFLGTEDPNSPGTGSKFTGGPVGIDLGQPGNMPSEYNAPGGPYDPGGNYSNNGMPSSSGSFPDLNQGFYHSGGLVRRYHSGDGVDALASDEVPAILQTGERVLNRQETAAHDAIFPQGILAAASPGGVGRGAIGEYPLGRNDAINAGAGPIGEALLGMGAGAGVGLMRGALASGVMSDITGAMTNPLMRGAQPTLKLTEDLGDGLMRYGIHMGGEDPVATALIQHPPGGVGQAYIHNIRMTSSITGEANALGPRNLMGVMKQFRNDNPGVTGFGGARVSGARAGGIYGAGGGDVNLSFPSFPSFHRGGMVTRYGLPVFDQGGSVDVLDQMLGDDNKRSTGDWSVGPNLGGGATISGVGPQVGKVTTDRTMDMLSMVVSKIGGLKDLFGGGDTGSSSGSDPTIQGDYGGYASDYAGPTLMHRGGLVVPRFHSGGLAGSELPSILTRLSGPAAAQLSPAAATGRSQPGNTVINQNIYTPDANSFRSTLDQTAAAALRAHDRAARNT